MIQYIQPERTDAARFLDWVQATVVGVEAAINTDQSYVVKIDNWFGKRWLGFSGKALGGLGVRKEKLTLPPFIPSRVVSQRRFYEGAPPAGRSKQLHVWQRSGENLQRYTDVVLQGAHAFWYQRSLGVERARELHGLRLNAKRVLAWYVSLRRAEKWRVVDCIGIGIRELETFARRRFDE
jgi:hypothetical protein